MQKELYDRYSPQFYAMCLRYASDEEMAKEILTEGFLSVFSGINDYRGEGPFEGWMRIIFLRHAVRVYRRDRKHVQMLGNSADMNAEHSTLPIDLRMDIREAITLAMKQLPDLQRQVFNLVAIEGYSFSEVKELLQLPQHNVKYAYYTAQKNLRTLLKNHLGQHYLKE